MFDILIAGGGPAGLTAAIYVKRAGKTAVVFEKDTPGGQINYAPRVDNYPGLSGIKGSDLGNLFAAQAKSFGAEIKEEEILGIERLGNFFKVSGSSKTYEARSVILATGLQRRKLNIEKEAELTGLGVSYCAICDGAFYEGLSVAVAGGGNTALEDALFLSGICKSVTIIHRRNKFRGEDALVKKLSEKPNARFLTNTVIESLTEDEGLLSGLNLKNTVSNDKSFLKTDGLFVAIGRKPDSKAFSGFLKTDAEGYFDADESCALNIPGIFAAGDCRKKAVRQLATAIGDGASAAMKALEYLERA